MLKKQMTREVMLDALEHDYNGLMNLGDIYGARGVEAAIDTIHLYRMSESAHEKIQRHQDHAGNHRRIPRLRQDHRLRRRKRTLNLRNLRRGQPPRLPPPCVPAQGMRQTAAGRATTARACPSRKIHIANAAHKHPLWTLCARPERISS